MEALGLAGGIGITVIAVLTLALKALSEAKGRRESAVLAAQEGAKATGLAAQLADMTNRFNEEKQRGDALDDLIAEMAVAGGAAGANDRLLAKWRAERAASRDRAPVVRDEETSRGEAEGAGSDDLMRPGD